MNAVEIETMSYYLTVILPWDKAAHSEEKHCLREWLLAAMRDAWFSWCQVLEEYKGRVRTGNERLYPTLLLDVIIHHRAKSTMTLGVVESCNERLLCLRMLFKWSLPEIRQCMNSVRGDMLRQNWMLRVRKNGHKVLRNKEMREGQRRYKGLLPSLESRWGKICDNSQLLGAENRAES